MENFITIQENFWESDFGKEYTNRNSYSTDEEWDKECIRDWGYTKIEMNNFVLADLPKDTKILEVGCNIGNQLRGFQRMGFTHLYGIELQQYAVELAKKTTRNINIIQGSGFDIPFKDNYFDLVCTNVVLIHISPDDHYRIMSEIFRCSKRYIMGFEYFADEITAINYRGNTNVLWKADFAKIYLDNFPNLRVVKRRKIPYRNTDEAGNVDEIFLLEKIERVVYS